MTQLVGKKIRTLWVRYRSIQPKEAKADFKSWLQKSRCPLNYLVLTSITTCLAGETQGMGDQREVRGDFQSGVLLSLLHPLPTATSHGTGDKSSQGRAMELSCPSSLSWLCSHHGSLVLQPRTPHAQQPAEGTEELDPWWSSVKWGHFWLVKLIMAAETLPCQLREEQLPQNCSMPGRSPQVPHLGWAP